MSPAQYYTINNQSDVIGKCNKITIYNIAVRKFTLSNYESGVIFNQSEQY
jgi:hypothetical protein